jgi:acetylornithine deacetylase/succinyl-diaminopimelate desuccinylase-like protein
MRRVLIAVTLLASTAFAQTPQPDWAKARQEMIGFIQDLVRIDTSNPPGNETKAAEYVKSVLDREGIPSQIFEKIPGRGNLVARLKGNGSKKPILLMGHLDVVGVERDKWTVDPFAAVIKDGYIYGRGSADDKNIVAAVLETFLQLHRLKVPLDRDVILVTEANEESDSEGGINYLISDHWNDIAAEYAYTEGPNPPITGGKLQWVGIATAEKVPSGGELTVHGTSGHASIPLLDNPVVHLAAAVAKAGQWRTQMSLNDTTRAFFAGLAKISPPEQAAIYTHLDDPKMQERLAAQQPLYYAMLHTTVVPTIINGGFRSNVIPGVATATIDIRALPQEEMEQFYAEMKKVINDPAVEFARTPAPRVPTPPSRLDTDFYRALAAAAQQVFGGATVLPVQAPFATDLAQLRAKGVQCYGFGPAAETERGPRMHGNDERVSIEEMGKYLQWLYTGVAQVSASR